jgi:hypothetical protein
MDKEHFVTLFDSYFLPQGVALIRSMERHIATEFKLWIVCLDDVTYYYFSKLNNPNLSLLRLPDLETTDLLEIKPHRTVAEYCWTLTPHVPKWVFSADKSIERITYLDADTWFFSDPSPIFNKFDKSQKEVLITEHAPYFKYDQTKISGIYCVQFITFNRHGGEIVRSWWEDRCNEWCYAVPHDGKFGDQKYLDVWPIKFKDRVYIAEDKFSFQAPWNAMRFNDLSPILYHFHGVRMLSWGNRILLDQTSYSIPKYKWQSVYIPYIEDLEYALETISVQLIKAKYKASLYTLIKTLLKNLARGKRIKILRLLKS